MRGFQLEGSRGLVFGVANQRSLAWSIVQNLHKQGAQTGIVYLNERALRRVQVLIDQTQAPLALPCDVQDDSQIEAVFQAAKELWGGLDFIVHSLAFAQIEDLKKPLHACSRSGYTLAMEVSAYSLLRLSHFAQPLMSEGGSITTLTYIGSEVAVPSYGVMGPTKAALESQVRYLAQELGEYGVRVNAVSAGPVKTLAAAGIPGFKELLRTTSTRTPMRRGVTHEEVAHTVTFLSSPLSSGITGEVIHVDCGAHAVSGYS